MESEWLGIVEESVPFETKHSLRKRRNGGIIFGTNSLKEGEMWHVDPFLDNDHETNNYTTAVTR
jgi:hypothetical protein